MMENLLQGLLAVAVYLDDILITGRDEKERYDNLQEVLKEAERSRPTTKERKVHGSDTIGCLIRSQNQCPRTTPNG